MRLELSNPQEWFLVVHPVAVRAAPRESAAKRGMLAAGQRIQVQNAVEEVCQSLYVRLDFAPSQ